MSTDVIYWLSAADLAALGKAGIIDIPGSERWAGDRALKLEWLSRKVPGKGGKGGMRTEYQPPADVLAQIHAFLEKNPDFFFRGKKSIINHPIGHGKTKNSAQLQQLAADSGHKTMMTLQDHHAEPVAHKQMVGVEDHRAEVLESLLVVCLKACSKVYGEPFQAHDSAVQLGYAADLYNLLVRMSGAMGGNMKLMQRLEADEIAQQLQLFIKLGQARKFPPQPEFMSVLF